MNQPYRTASEMWQREGGAQWMEWDALITWFLHYGAVVSTPDAFILARPIAVDAPDLEHETLPDAPKLSDLCNCWNVWFAAGQLDFLAVLAHHRPMPWVSFIRARGQHRVRRYNLHQFLRHHGKIQSAQTAATAASTTAADYQHRPGARTG